MARRDDRKDAIRAIVRTEDMRTQKDLVERLQADGFDCTQATVSRDIAEMGLVKSDKGFYALPEDLALKRHLHDLAISAEAAGNLIVVKTRSGSANMVAEVVDTAVIAGLVGTIAGDNTIMVVARTEQDAARIARRFEEMIAGM